MYLFMCFFIADILQNPEKLLKHPSDLTETKSIKLLGEVSSYLGRVIKSKVASQKEDIIVKGVINAVKIWKEDQYKQDMQSSENRLVLIRIISLIFIRDELRVLIKEEDKDYLIELIVGIFLNSAGLNLKIRNTLDLIMKVLVSKIKSRLLDNKVPEILLFCMKEEISLFEEMAVKDAKFGLTMELVGRMHSLDDDVLQKLFFYTLSMYNKANSTIPIKTCCLKILTILLYKKEKVIHTVSDILITITTMTAFLFKNFFDREFIGSELVKIHTGRRYEENEGLFFIPRAISEIKTHFELCHKQEMSNSLIMPSFIELFSSTMEVLEKLAYRQEIGVGLSQEKKIPIKEIFTKLLNMLCMFSDEEVDVFWFKSLKKIMEMSEKINIFQCILEIGFASSKHDILIWNLIKVIEVQRKDSDYTESEFEILQNTINIRKEETGKEKGYVKVFKDLLSDIPKTERRVQFICLLLQNKNLFGTEAGDVIRRFESFFLEKANKILKKGASSEIWKLNKYSFLIVAGGDVEAFVKSPELFYIAIHLIFQTDNRLCTRALGIVENIVRIPSQGKMLVSWRKGVIIRQVYARMVHEVGSGVLENHRNYASIITGVQNIDKVISESEFTDNNRIEGLTDKQRVNLEIINQILYGYKTSNSIKLKLLSELERSLQTYRKSKNMQYLLEFFLYEIGDRSLDDKKAEILKRHTIRVLKKDTQNRIRKLFVSVLARTMGEKRSRSIIITVLDTAWEYEKKEGEEHFIRTVIQTAFTRYRLEGHEWIAEYIKYMEYYGEYIQVDDAVEFYLRSLISYETVEDLEIIVRMALYGKGTLTKIWKGINKQEMKNHSLQSFLSFLITEQKRKNDIDESMEGEIGILGLILYLKYKPESKHKEIIKNTLGKKNINPFHSERESSKSQSFEYEVQEKIAIPYEVLRSLFPLEGLDILIEADSSRYGSITVKKRNIIDILDRFQDIPKETRGKVIQWVTNAILQQQDKDKIIFAKLEKVISKRLIYEEDRSRVILLLDYFDRTPLCNESYKDWCICEICNVFHDTAEICYIGRENYLSSFGPKELKIHRLYRMTSLRLTDLGRSALIEKVACEIDKENNVFTHSVLVSAVVTGGLPCTHRATREKTHRELFKAIDVNGRFVFTMKPSNIELFVRLCGCRDHVSWVIALIGDLFSKKNKMSHVELRIAEILIRLELINGTDKKIAGLAPLLKALIVNERFELVEKLMSNIDGPNLFLRSAILCKVKNSFNMDISESLAISTLGECLKTGEEPMTSIKRSIISDLIVISIRNSDKGEALLLVLKGVVSKSLIMAEIFFPIMDELIQKNELSKETIVKLLEAYAFHIDSNTIFRERYLELVLEVYSNEDYSETEGRKGMEGLFKHVLVADWLDTTNPKLKKKFYRLYRNSLPKNHISRLKTILSEDWKIPCQKMTGIVVFFILSKKDTLLQETIPSLNVFLQRELFINNLRKSYKKIDKRKKKSILKAVKGFLNRSVCSRREPGCMINTLSTFFMRNKMSITSRIESDMDPYFSLISIFKKSNHTPSLAQKCKLLMEEECLVGVYLSRGLISETRYQLELELIEEYPKAQYRYEKILQLASENSLMYTAAEFEIWEERWIFCSQKLHQWGVLADLLDLKEDRDISIFSGFLKKFLEDDPIFTSERKRCEDHFISMKKEGTSEEYTKNIDLILLNAVTEKKVYDLWKESLGVLNSIFKNLVYDPYLRIGHLAQHWLRRARLMTEVDGVYKLTLSGATYGEIEEFFRTIIKRSKYMNESPEEWTFLRLVRERLLYFLFARHGKDLGNLIENVKTRLLSMTPNMLTENKLMGASLIVSAGIIGDPLSRIKGQSDVLLLLNDPQNSFVVDEADTSGLEDKEKAELLARKADFKRSADILEANKICKEALAFDQECIKALRVNNDILRERLKDSKNIENLLELVEGLVKIILLEENKEVKGLEKLELIELICRNGPFKTAHSSIYALVKNLSTNFWIGCVWVLVSNINEITKNIIIDLIKDDPENIYFELLSSEFNLKELEKKNPSIHRNLIYFCSVFKKQDKEAGYIKVNVFLPNIGRVLGVEFSDEYVEIYTDRNEILKGIVISNDKRQKYAKLLDGNLKSFFRLLNYTLNQDVWFRRREVQFETGEGIDLGNGIYLMIEREEIVRTKLGKRMSGPMGYLSFWKKMERSIGVLLSSFYASGIEKIDPSIFVVEWSGKVRTDVSYSSSNENKFSRQIKTLLSNSVMVEGFLKPTVFKILSTWKEIDFERLYYLFTGKEISEDAKSLFSDLSYKTVGSLLEKI
eukprot:GHVP01057979.1.p1 GENE.GHVP01057979.1~~GHVP01057979.1.p1  ORF type:complete len:2445 (+),score=415.07 GHVP01057979.1:461-7336(+)